MPAFHAVDLAACRPCTLIFLHRSHVECITLLIIQDRAVKNFEKVNADFGRMLRTALKEKGN